jgi:carotenoid phi-ring synthase / carotenoid chi-ring synthase
MNQRFNSLPPRIARRTVLKLFGIGTVSGLAGYSRFTKPQPIIFQEDFLALPQKLDQLKSVVVIGGGLAGLACAYELSQRGFVVTLLEKGPQLGGKVASWSIQVGDETLMMEHGFHGFFPQYYNLNRLLNELEVSKNFRSLNFYSVLYRESKYAPEVFRPSNSAFPWNVLDLSISSSNSLGWGINLSKYKHWQIFREIAGFHPQKSFQRLDHLSVAEWVKNDFPKGLYNLYFLPFTKSSLNSPDTMSAGELMQFFHFYFFGNPEGLAFNATYQDMGRCLVQPIVDAITKNNGNIITESNVSRIQTELNKITSIHYHKMTTSSSVPFWVKSSSTVIHPHIEYLDDSNTTYTISSNTQHAISLSCTHQGCKINQVFNSEGKKEFLCPCHGARYDAEGHVISGPAKQDLPRFRIIQKRDEQIQLLAIQAKKVVIKTIKADYYVFAADIPGIKHIFTLVDGDLSDSLIKQVNQLTVADPFAVVRFWLDKDFEWEHSNFSSLSGYKLTDSIALYHRLQQDYIAWAKRTGGSVVELHAYCYKEKEFPTQQILLTTFEQELYEIVPELKGAKILHREVVNQKNFAGFPPNSYKNRPCTRTIVSNILFAGDWVKMPFPCGLMERAVSSGFLAANEILQQEGLQRRKIFSIPEQGILQI